MSFLQPLLLFALPLVALPIITFLLTSAGGYPWMMGYASAPYDPRWAQRHPTRYALMSLAGPAANFILSLVGFVRIQVVFRA